MQVSGAGSGIDMMAMRQQRFSEVDADSSGGLNLEEFAELHENRPGKPGDVESDKSVDEIFSEIDSDGDGELTHEELEAHRQNNPPPGPPGGMMSSDMFASLQELLEDFDTDANGTLNAEEFAAFHEAKEADRPDDVSESRSAEELFDEIDADGDGELSADELEQHQASGAARHLNHLVGVNGFSTLLAAQEAA